MTFLSWKKGWALLLVLLGNGIAVMAQTEPEDIKVDSDRFQDYFYESVFQKSIENYDKSLVALEQCLKLQPGNPTVYYEMGKNYLFAKEYKNAYTAFEKASELTPENKWIWIGMYDVCYATKDFNQAIAMVNKIIPFDAEYKEDLVSLYMATKQQDKALELINELNQKVGKTEAREMYKMEILSQGKYQNAEIENLKALIAKNPKEESNYLALIFLYSSNKQEDKVEEVSKQLEKAIPSSLWAQVSLFKTYLDNKDGLNAVKSMNAVLGSSKIDDKIKHRVFNEFLLFTNTNPHFIPDLDQAIDYFKNDANLNVAKEVGKLYFNKKDWQKAIKYFDMASKRASSPDLETAILWLETQTQLKQFEAVEKRALDMIGSFPAAPEFYYYGGMAYNQLKLFKKAKELLEMGMDYVVENKTMEINFNIQLGEASHGLGDAAKKELYFNKANQLLKEKE